MSRWDALAATMDGSSGTYSACVWRDGDLLYEYNADAIHPAASLIKVPLCMAVWDAGHRQHSPSLDLATTVTLRDHDRVEGDGGFDQAPEGTVRTYRDLIGHALRESDNTAANALIDALGMEQVNIWMHGTPLGLETMMLRRRFMDWAAAAAGRENLTTAREMCQVFAYLLREERRYKALLGWLSTSPYDMKLVAGVPRGTNVAHKVGDLPGVEHDAGIVYAPAGPFVVALLGSALPNAHTGTATLAEASRLIYEAMTL